MFRKLFDLSLRLASPGFRRELERRNVGRGKNSRLWFTPEEAAVAGTLARIIVPSEEGAPGIEDVCAPGQSVADLLDKLVAENHEKCEFYSRGLLAFDYLALSERRRRFADLSGNDQANLFRSAQQRHNSRTVNTSRISKLRRAFETLIYARKGMLHAERLYPVIRNDCLEIFYTSGISWAWLQYDGPPMDNGYCSLIRPRLSGRL